MMSGVGLGDNALIFFGQACLMGMNNAIETLVAQAAGAGNLKLAGVYLNRGRFLLTVSYIPIVVLLLNVENILVKIGQDPKASAYA